MSTKFAVETNDRQNTIDKSIQIAFRIFQRCNWQEPSDFTLAEWYGMCSPVYFIAEKVAFRTFFVLPPCIPVTPPMLSPVSLSTIHIQADDYWRMFVCYPLEMGMDKARTCGWKIIPVDTWVATRF